MDDYIEILDLEYQDIETLEDLSAIQEEREYIEHIEEQIKFEQAQ